MSAAAAPTLSTEHRAVQHQRASAAEARSYDTLSLKHRVFTQSLPCGRTFWLTKSGV